MPDIINTTDDLPVNPELISKLKKANFLYTKKILNFSIPELQQIAKITAYEANIILQAACAAELMSNEEDALSILHKANTGNEMLSFEFFNSSLFGGIYTGTITEICGESGAGKTQLCLLLSLNSVVPGNLEDHKSKVLFMHTEGKFPIQRFVELSKAFKKKNPAYENVNFMDNLILKKVYNLKEAIWILQRGIPDLHQKNIFPKVIIIDSVAELLRGEYNLFNLRNLMIQQLSSEIWKVANTYKMAAICVNQVSGSIQKSTTTSGITSTDIPSLGVMWANVLTTRLKVFHRGLREQSIERTFEVVFSSYHPHLAINFLITSDGVQPLEDHLL